MYGYEVFHEDMLKALISAVRHGQVQHAYIFEGEDGIGKKRAADLFAASLVCESSQLAPCGNCAACVGAKAKTNPDIKYITTGDKKSIGVESMRDIVSDAYVRPFESARKVYIIENGGAITEQAQNSFLKMLEEPPEYTVFIILVSNLSMLLQTIISRCTVLRFTPLSREKVKSYIKVNYPDGDADFLSKYAEGNPGKIDKIMERDDFFALRSETLKMIIPLVSRHRISAYKTADFLEENKEDAVWIIELWQSMFRDIIFIQNGAAEAVINSDILNDLSNLAGRIEPKVCFAAEEMLKKAETMLRRYVNLRAAALNLSLSIKKEAYDE